MSLDLEMANAAIAERKFGDAGTADDIERWRREVEELRLAIATVRDTALEEAATVADEYLGTDSFCAAAIRALKGMRT